MADSKTPPTPPEGTENSGPKAAKENPELDAGQGDVQHQMQVEQEQGFRGTKVDPTPDEHYTLDGVIAGKPTPETDADAAAEAFRATTGRG